MSFRTVLLSFCAALLAACSNAALAPGLPGGSAASGAPEGSSIELAKSLPHVFWTLFASCSYPQIQFAKVPLKTTSKAANLDCTKRNGLSYSSGLHVDRAGRLWVLNFGTSYGDPGSAAVFKLPLKPTSNPEYTFVLLGTNDPDHLTFDASGNLWVSSHAHGITEYTGPFTKSGTLSPVLTLTKGISGPSGIALDKHNNVYVSNFGGTSSTSIAVFTKPSSKKPAYYLKGLTQPGGLIFDKSGNLYASINGPSKYAIARYNATDLGSGETPNVVDPTGLSSSYESDFAISGTGDLYVADCGATANVFVYPTSRKKFTSTLAPSVDYTNADIQAAACVWGIAIK